MGRVRYIPRIEHVRNVEHGQIIEGQRVVIYEELTSDSGVSIRIPSALNPFLERWKRTSITNPKNYADTVCAFLNYVKVQCDDGDDDEFDKIVHHGIYALDFYHAARFIDYSIVVKNVNRRTANQYTRRILEFYLFLLESKILDPKKIRFSYTYRYVKGHKGKKKCIVNPLDKPPYNVSYPSKENIKMRKLVNMDEHLWKLFLKVSEKYAPDITFGIALQICGGLRRGEVVNLTLDSVNSKRRTSNDTSRMELFVENKSEELFSDRPDVDMTKCQPKKQRKQIAYNFDNNLYEYYRKHLEFRNNILAKTANNTIALFIDEEGNAMDGVTYEKRWNTVKRRFLKELEKNTYAEYIRLVKGIWGTHIGRGIFTNLCLTYGFAKTARELANLRGDDGTESSQPYIDDFETSKIIAKTLNVIANEVDMDK